MSRTLSFVLALTLLLPAVAVAHSHSAIHGNDELGWAVIRGEDHHTSSMDDLDEVDDLKSRFGDDFLYIRDGDERYVITNTKLIERAEEASRRVGKYGREIGTLARAQARLAVDRGQGHRAKAKLVRLEARLESRIARGDARGDEMEDLRQELERVREEIEKMEARDDEGRLTESETRDLERQRDEARDRLREAVGEMREEIRDILREAKEKDQAERIR